MAYVLLENRTVGLNALENISIREIGKSEYEVISMSTRDDNRVLANFDSEQAAKGFLKKCQDLLLSAEGIEVHDLRG